MKQELMQATVVSEEQYLDTSFEHDMDFVDGTLEERSVGTQLHGILQILVAIALQPYKQTHQAFVEVRLRIHTGRYRIPDVMLVTRPYKKSKVVTDTPLLVVEIKSPDDTFDSILARFRDYEAIGVPNILLLDPERQRAWAYCQGSLESLGQGIVIQAEPLVELGIAELFAAMEESHG